MNTMTQFFPPLTDYQKERIAFVADYVQDTTQDWLLVKRHLINAFNPPNRIFFSTRHPQTKKHFINEFDEVVINHWQSLTGVKLEIEPEKLHDPCWVYKPKGWALIKRNNEQHNKVIE